MYAHENMINMSSLTNTYYILFNVRSTYQYSALSSPLQEETYLFEKSVLVVCHKLLILIYGRKGRYFFNVRKTSRLVAH